MSMFVRINIQLDENTWNRNSDGDILTQVSDNLIAALDSAEIAVVRDGEITTSTVIEEVEGPLLVLDETW